MQLLYSCHHLLSQLRTHPQQQQDQIHLLEISQDKQRDYALPVDIIMENRYGQFQGVLCVHAEYWTR